METTPTDIRPLAEQVAQRLKQYIRDQRLKGGDRLPTEAALAEQMGVARSTVREAIKRLESQNVLTVRQGAGSFVTELPGQAEDPLGLQFSERPDRLVGDLLQVRLMMEPSIAALAAQNAAPEHILELQKLYQTMERHILAGEEYLEEDMRFHQVLAIASGNQVAQKLMPVIIDAMGKVSSPYRRDFLQETLDTHKDILEAVKMGDTIGARGAMTLHLSYADSVCRQVRRLQERGAAMPPRVPDWVLEQDGLRPPKD